MKYFKVLGVLALALAALPATSFAQMAYVARAVNLRAGPATEYPVVAVLQEGVSISVEGCLSDYRWCDVVAGPNRGWAYAGNIVYPYQGANVPVLTYGAVIGLGIVAFTVGDYWDHHYRSSAWYPQRQRWVDRRWPDAHRPPMGRGFGPGDHRPRFEPRVGRDGHRPLMGPGDHRSRVGPGIGRDGHRPSMGTGTQLRPAHQGVRQGDRRQPRQDQDAGQQKGQGRGR